MPHDAFGFHPSACKTGNRKSLYTIRHDAFQGMFIRVIRWMGNAALAVSHGAGNWLGPAAWNPSKTNYRKADVVMPHALGPGKHIFFDNAVTSATMGTALNAAPSSATESGVAAELRAARKLGKYGPLAAGVSSQFKPAVIERHGAFCDSLTGTVKQLCGDRDRDPLLSDDYTFAASSKSTYMAGLLCFSVVIADAAMLDMVIGMDTKEIDDEQTPPLQPHGQRPRAEQRDIEGRGGVTMYDHVRRE